MPVYTSCTGMFSIAWSPFPYKVIQCNLRQKFVPQGEMINDSGTMTGGGGKPRGGRMRLGSGAPKSVDQRAAKAELEAAEKQEHASTQALRLSTLPCLL